MALTCSGELRAPGSTSKALMGLVVILSFAMSMIFISAPPSDAARLGWYTGDALYGHKYTQGTVRKSQTGILAGFKEASGIGQAEIRVWFGGSYTTCWYVECQINGTRSYKKGAFRWKAPGASGERLRSVAYGTGVKNPGGMVLPSGTTTSDAMIRQDGIPAGVREAATAVGVAFSAVNRVSTNGARSVWVAEWDQVRYLWVGEGANWAFGGSISAESHESHSLTMSYAHGRSGQKLVYLDTAEDGDQARRVLANAGYENLAPGIYLGDSTSFAAEDLGSARSTVTTLATGYQLLGVGRAG